MQRLFGSRNNTPRATTSAAPTPRPEADPPAMDNIYETRDILEKREAHVLRLIAAEVDAARKYQAGNRKREALECIKRKRIHDKELERLSAQKINLAQQEQMLQQLRVTNVVNSATRATAAAIEREVRRGGGAAGMDELHDRLEDALADGAEMLEASGRPMGEAAALDDDELLEELDALELESRLTETDDEFARVPEPRQAVVQPAIEAAPVPRFDPVAARKAQREKEERAAEERELAQLTATMGTEQPMPQAMGASSYWEEREWAPRAPMHLDAAIMPMPMMAACY